MVECVDKLFMAIRRGLCVRAVVFALGAFLVCGAPARRVVADDVTDAWTVDISKQHPPLGQENRIIKWCADDSDGVRYASANIELKGYHPCGELHTTMQCDPSGARMINPPGDFPPAYRDCSIGPRIKVTRHDPLPEPADTNVDATELAQGAGLSADEQRRLKREFAAAQADAEKREEREMQEAMRAIFSAFGGTAINDGTSPGRSRGSSRTVPRDQQKQLQDILRLIGQP